MDNTTLQVLSDKVLNMDNDFRVKFKLQQLEENTWTIKKGNLVRLCDYLSSWKVERKCPFSLEVLKVHRHDTWTNNLVEYDNIICNDKILIKKNIKR